MNDVVITGIGVVTAAGTGCLDFAAALRAGRSGIRQHPVTEHPGIEIGALLTGFTLEDELRKVEDIPADLIQRTRTAIRRAPLSPQVSVVSATQGWCSAGLHRRAVDASRISVVIGGQNLNQRPAYEFQQKYADSLTYVPASYSSHFMDTDQVGILSEVFQIRGEGMTIGGASASGNLGLIQGARLIRSGAADVCVVVGAMMDLSPLEFHAFASLGVTERRASLPAEATCRPFDREHGGFVYGQGSACMILESRSSAERGGIAPIATLAGYALNLDGNRSTDPDSAGQEKAMRQALCSADLPVAELDYINTHGTGTPLGDESEIRAIKSLLGGRVAGTWLNSTKSLTGHCLTAAGVIEAVAVVLQMQGDFLHPNLNLESPIDAECRFAGARAQSPVTLKTALSNSFGFGGINSSIALRNVRD